MTIAGKGQYASFKAHLDYMKKHGERAGTNRPADVRGEYHATGCDELLKRLRAVHGRPRYDLFVR